MGFFARLFGIEQEETIQDIIEEARTKGYHTYYPASAVGPYIDTGPNGSDIRIASEADIPQAREQVRNLKRRAK